MAEQAASAALVAEASLLEGCLELSAGAVDAVEPERARALRDIGARFDALHRVLFSATPAAPRAPARGARGEKLHQAADLRADELAWKSAEEVAGRVAALRRASSDMQAPEVDAGWAAGGALQRSEERVQAKRGDGNGSKRVDAEMEMAARTVPATAGRHVQATANGSKVPARTSSGSTLSPASGDSSPRRSVSPPPTAAAEAGRPALCSNGSNGDAHSDVPLHVLHGLQGARAAADAAGVAPLRKLLRGSPQVAPQETRFEKRVSEVAPRTDGSPRAGAARPTTAPSAGRSARAGPAAPALGAIGVGVRETARRGAATQRGPMLGGSGVPRGGGGAAEGADGNGSKGAGVLALLRGSPVPQGKAAERAAAAPSHARRRPDGNGSKVSASGAPRAPGHQLALVPPPPRPPPRPSY